MKAHLVKECVDESSGLFTAAKVRSLQEIYLDTEPMSAVYILQQIHSSSMKNLFSSPCENVSGILPLPLKLTIFISSWQGRILSCDF